MLPLGRLSHLSREKQDLVLSINPDMTKTSSGRFCIPRSRVFLTNLQLAGSWLPQLLVKNKNKKRKLLGPKIFGCRVADDVWYCPLTTKLRRKPTVLRGGVVRSLRKLQTLGASAEEFLILTTAERIGRARELFGTAQIMTFAGFAKRMKKKGVKRISHLVLDEQYRIRASRKILVEAIRSVDCAYRWIVNPYFVHSKCRGRDLRLLLSLLLLPVPVVTGTCRVHDNSKSTALSLSTGRCCVCYEESVRLVDVCGKGHRCCVGCSARVRRCMLCRAKKKYWL